MKTTVAALIKPESTRGRAMNADQLAALKSFLAALGTSPDATRRVLAAAAGADPTRPSKLVNTREAAVLIECHPKSLFRYARRGLLHPVRRSARCIRWRADEVERFAAGGAGQ